MHPVSSDPEGSRWNAHQLKSWKSVCWFFSRVVVLFTYASIFRFLYRNLRQNWAINPFHSIKRFADRKSLKFATSIWTDYNEINFDGVFSFHAMKSLRLSHMPPPASQIQLVVVRQLCIELLGILLFILFYVIFAVLTGCTFVTFHTASEH